MGRPPRGALSPGLIGQGTADGFLDEPLRPTLFRDARGAHGQALELRMREGYDHGYDFVATFMEAPLRHHAAHLDQE